MSTVLHPVGPNPSRVYWVRRLVVMVALVVVVAALAAVVWFVAFRGDGAAGSDAAGGDAAGSNAADKVGTNGDSAAPATPVDCTAAELQLAVAADASQYPAGANPVLHASVTNIGTAPCTVDAGDVAREVVISSGADRIWSSKDCASAETGSRQLLLDAGGRDLVDIPWGRVRSGEGCPTDLPAPRAGTYQATATLLGVSAEPAVFALQ